jgi:hypothetical protein
VMRKFEIQSNGFKKKKKRDSKIQNEHLVEIPAWLNKYNTSFEELAL